MNINWTVIVIMTIWICSTIGVVVTKDSEIFMVPSILTLIIGFIYVLTRE